MPIITVYLLHSRRNSSEQVYLCVCVCVCVCVCMCVCVCTSVLLDQWLRHLVTSVLYWCDCVIRPDVTYMCGWRNVEIQKLSKPTCLCFQCGSIRRVRSEDKSEGRSSLTSMHVSTHHHLVLPLHNVRPFSTLLIVRLFERVGEKRQVYIGLLYKRSGLEWFQSEGRYVFVRLFVWILTWIKYSSSDCKRILQLRTHFLVQTYHTLTVPR